VTDAREIAADASAAPSAGPSVEDVAREAVGWLRTGPDVDRAELRECTLVNRRLPHFWYASATRVQLDPSDVADAIGRVRRWFRDRGRPEFVWMLGPDHGPADLADRLLADGARREPGMLTAMVLDHEPPPGPDDIAVRRVMGFEDFVLSQEITIAGFGFSPEEAAAERAAYEASWAHWRTEPDRTLFLAVLEGRAIAEAGMAPTIPGPFVLSGGATLPDARGRGAYRALVRARWEEAVRRGTPALVVQASPMSRPILERSGFRSVGEIALVIDESGRQT
jgi:GNAT superfamily N-acetyltransferase